MKASGWFSELYEKVKDSFEFKLKEMELEITENILSIMQKRNMSRKELADKIGTSKAAVSKLLSDGSNVTLRRLLRISEALDCDVKIEIVPNEQNVSVYELEIPVFINIEGAYKYWLSSLGNSGQVTGHADWNQTSFTVEVPNDADAA